jgi:hypothetical protein
MRVICILIVAIGFFACTKSKFTTKPQLKFKSVNSKDISGSQLLEIKLRLTDKEGDFSNFFAIKKSVAHCSASNFVDSSGKFSIPPDFINTHRNEGEVIITLNKIDRGSNGCFAPGGGVKIDTAIFSFWTKDQAGNYSDTAFSDPIIIRN